MRIAMVVDSFPELTQTFVLHQITGLLDLGHDVRLISVVRPYQDVVHPEIEQYNLLDRTVYLGVPNTRAGLVAAAPASLIRLLSSDPGGFVPSLKRMDRRRGVPNPASFIAMERLPNSLDEPDIIHCQFGPLGKRALHARKLTGVPLITSFRGYDAGSWTASQAPGIYDDLFQLGDGFMVVSDFLGRRLSELGCPAEKVTRHYSGSAVHAIPFRPRTAPERSPVNILSIGRLTEKKGLEYSIMAVARLVERGYDISYRIAGEGELRPRLEQLIADLELQDRVHLLGWCDRTAIYRQLDEAHLFVLASVVAADGDHEGMAGVLREAGAAGLPVITTKHAGNPEAIDDGVTGFLVPERDVDALEERLQYLLDHPHLWPEMGRSGRKLVEDKFDLRGLNQRLVAIYQNVIDGRPPGHGLP